MRAGTDVPQEVGGYRLLGKLAEGGMAEVWLARRSGLGEFEKTAAVKLILPWVAEDAEFVAMFLDEARLVARFSHPNIVHTYDVGEAAGRLFLVMEHVDGPNAARLAMLATASGKPLSPVESACVVLQAAAGLAYAHGFVDPQSSRPLELVHRDVSPQNLLVSTSGVVKVADFGIARAATNRHRTQGGIIKGKLPYMAPEQVRGGRLDARVDVWGLGVVLYELCTGSRPFKGPDALMLRAILEDAPALPSDLNDEIGPELQGAILRALEKDPEKRTASAAAFRAELVAAVGAAAADAAPILEARLRSFPLPKPEALAPVKSAEPAPAPLPPTVPSIDTRPLAIEAEPHTQPAPAPSPPAPTTGRATLAIGAVLTLVGIGAGIFAGTKFLRPVAPVPSPEPAIVEPLPAPSSHSPAPAPTAPPPLVAEPPAPEPAPAAPPEPQRPAAHRPKPTRPTPSHPVPAPVPAPAPVLSPPPTKPRGTGHLTVETRPYTEVLLDGRSLGETPLLDRAVPAGPHQLELRNPRYGIRKVIDLDVQEGAPSKQQVAFKIGKLRVTAPAGTAIALDGHPLGSAPLPPTDVAVGRHTVKVGNASHAVEVREDAVADVP